MRTSFFNACLLFCALTVSGCSGPIGPIAGGALEGTVKPWPQDWAFAAERENILLQTNSADPYSVTLWGVSIDEYYYVASSSQQNQWTVNLQNDPQILLGIEGNLFSESLPSLQIATKRKKCSNNTRLSTTFTWKKAKVTKA